MTDPLLERLGLHELAEGVERFYQSLSAARRAALRFKHSLEAPPPGWFKRLLTQPNHGRGSNRKLRLNRERRRTRAQRAAGGPALG